MSVLKVFVNSDPFVWWSLNEDKLMKMNSDYQLKCYIFIDQSIDIFTLIFNLVVKRLKQRFQTLKFQTLLWITNDDLLIQTLTNKTNLNSINIGQFISNSYFGNIALPFHNWNIFLYIERGNGVETSDETILYSLIVNYKVSLLGIRY